MNKQDKFDRQTQLDNLRSQVFDTFIIGGGINGAVAAAALSAKGASVGLIDRADFAQETSSQSSNLVWGGIKYLETREFALVNKLCKSRNELMESFPSTVQEIRFLTTIQKGFRFPPAFIYAGSVLYWLFGRFKTRAPKYLSTKAIKKRAGAVNIDNVTGGFEYSDCFLYDNDSRFVFNFVRSAQKNGATTLNYLEAIDSNYDGDIWTINVKDQLTGGEFPVKSKTLVNACGPWADQQNQVDNINTQHHHLFSKGVHLTVPKLSDNERVLAFFASDGRLFFVIPMGPVTCVGTTDTQVENPESFVSDDDREFILSNINALLDLDKPLSKEDIIAERCGVRPLAAKPSDEKADWVALSRKHAIDIDVDRKHLSIFGGKTTDCINVGEEVSEVIAGFGVGLMDTQSKWFGEPDAKARKQFLEKAKAIKLDALTPTSSPEPLSRRLWRRYGCEAMPMLDAIKHDPSQAELVIEDAEYIRCELNYTAQHEMICELDDFLRRRSKIAMVVRADKIKRSQGLVEACKIFFGDQWQEKLDSYLNTPNTSSSNSSDPNIATANNSGSKQSNSQ